MRRCRIASASHAAGSRDGGGQSPWEAPAGAVLITVCGATAGIIGARLQPSVSRILTVRVSVVCSNDRSMTRRANQWCFHKISRGAILPRRTWRRHEAEPTYRMHSGDILEPAVVTPVPSHVSEPVLSRAKEQALSLPRGRPRDFFAEMLQIHYDLPVSEVEGVAVDLARRSLCDKERL